MKNSNVLNKWFYPKLPTNVKKYVFKPLNSGFINDGPLSKYLANEIKKKCDRRYATCVTSGSTALLISLLAAGIGRGDKVIVPAFTYIATINSITMAGAEPIFVDIDLNNLCIDLNEIERCIKRDRKIKAVMSVEVNGRSPDNFELTKLLNKYNKILLTDSAESLGSNFKEKPLASFGLISSISLSPNKIITTGQGGIILTNSKKIFKKICAIKLQGNHNRGDGGSDKFYMKGLNFKFTDIQASVGIPQLNLIQKRLKNTEELRKSYIKKLSDYGFEFIQKENYQKLLWVDCFVKNKKKQIQLLKNSGIAFREFWPPNYLQKPYLNKKKFLRNTEFASNNGIWLASNFDLQPKHIEKSKLRKY